jgi:succinate dehydrogenase hydrophobic anchor subunit
MSKPWRDGELRLWLTLIVLTACAVCGVIGLAYLLGSLA